MGTIRPSSGVRRGTGRVVTPRDIALVAWVASQRFVLAGQAQAWLGAGRVVTYRRLQALVSLGLLRHERIFHAQPGVYLATNGGLALCGSPLPRARVDLRCYRHDLGVVWLALALAREWGGGEEASGRVVTEREMRSADGRSESSPAGGRFAIALAGA